MCMLFVRVCHNPQPGQYRLVLVNIRDEYLTRRSQPVHAWAHNRNIVGGMDIEQGRELGATWLAMNRENGKIGCLLNVLQPLDEVPAGTKQRRGTFNVLI